MSKQIDALKLALEALETAWYHVGTFCPTDEAIELYDEARAAIKEALAQPEQRSVSEHLEPVVWQQVMERAFWRMYDHGKDNNPVSAQCEIQALRLLCDGTFDDVTAWHPSQWKLPQRRPLTENQIEKLLDAVIADKKTKDQIGDFARAIEAAHGIKE